MDTGSIRTKRNRRKQLRHGDKRIGAWFRSLLKQNENEAVRWLISVAQQKDSRKISHLCRLCRLNPDGVGQVLRLIKANSVIARKIISDFEETAEGAFLRNLPRRSQESVCKDGQHCSAIELLAMAHGESSLL